MRGIPSLKDQISPCRPDMSKSLLRFMHEILTALIEESATLSEGVLETLLNQLDAYADVSNQTKIFSQKSGTYTPATADTIARWIHACVDNSARNSSKASASHSHRKLNQ